MRLTKKEMYMNGWCMLCRSVGASFLSVRLVATNPINELDPRERVADLNERTKQLEDASHSFAAQVRYGVGFNGYERQC